MMLWLDGALRPAAEARIDPADRGLLLGDGLFETLAVRDGSARHLAAHLDRLARGAATLGIASPDPGSIEGAIGAVLRANRLREGSLRITLTRGPGPRGLAPPEPARPTLLVTAAPQAAARPPARAVVSTLVRRFGLRAGAAGGVKTLAYADAVVALREAAARGGDEALLPGPGAGLAEATAANLFVCEGGRIATPPLEDGALPGLRRARLLALGDAVERSIGPAALRAADAVFLASSLGLRVVATLDGAPLARDDARVARLGAQTA